MRFLNLNALGEQLAQRVEAHRTEGERVTVESAQREAGTELSLTRAARLAPQPRTDLEGKRLPRPAEVAIHLEPRQRRLDESEVHEHAARELGGPFPLRHE